MTARRTPPGSVICPRCGAELEELGNCPTCLLQLGLAAGGGQLDFVTGDWLGPYRILAPLGIGGMGEVYRARDSRLGREVAIKILPDERACDPGARARFEQEVHAAAALSHANIVALYDLGEDAGQRFAVMELLEGQTLRHLLGAGPLPWRRALDLGTQVARGLAAAHDKGIVHRDLKPENIFVTSGDEVKILDFGLAKQIGSGRDDGRGGGFESPPGVLVGTASYMAPEQARSEPVDARADIFAFGAVLYELLSGRRAFPGASPEAAISAVLTTEPPALASSSAAVPAPLARLVARCLEKKPADRVQSARELLLAIEALGSARPGSAAAAAAPLRLAVLPFENLGDAADEYFADGMADAVRGKLTTLSCLEVIARSSSTPYKKASKPPEQIAAELGVGWLLLGTIRWQRAGERNRVEVSPELVELRSSGAPVLRWQESFDAELTEVFAVQSDIASRVAAALGLAWGAGEAQRLVEQPTSSLHAYDAFLRGEEAANSLAATDPLSLRRAILHYERAVALDPGFAQAWAQLARAGALICFLGVPDPALAQRVHEAVERTVALSPAAPECHLAQGDEKRWVERDPAGALAAYLEGQSGFPAHADLLAAAAMAEQGLGRWVTAIEHLQVAARLDPHSLSSKRRLGYGLLCLRRYHEARVALDHGLSLSPGNLSLLAYKAMSFVAEGDLDGALDVVRTVPGETEPTELVAYFATYGLGWLLDDAGRALLERLTASAFDGDRAVWALCLAESAALRGETRSVVRHAEEARVAFSREVGRAAENPRRLAGLGLALAYLGDGDAARRAGERAVALLPVSRDAYTGNHLEQILARILVLVGEPAAALEHLESMLARPHHLSPGWLRVDPAYSTLRGDVRFARLAGPSGRGNFLPA